VDRKPRLLSRDSALVRILFFDDLCCGICAF
jgi:hypothetical protein